MTNSTTSQLTTNRQQLTSAIKSARDAMRKDAGLSGDVDRIPQLAWLLFLKAYDDLERKRQAMEAQIAVLRAEFEVEEVEAAKTIGLGSMAPCSSMKTG